MFACVFVTFPCDALGQVLYLVVLIPDLCLLPYWNLSLSYFGCLAVFYSVY